jgi:signal transduction histidine kinase
VRLHRAADLSRGIGVQAALAAGFAVVFGLWLLWGYQLLRNLQRVEDSIGSLQESYMRGEQTLLTVRTNVLLGSIYLRDALIDAGSPRREYYRDELTRLRDEVEALLRTYVPEVDSPVERDQWARLQIELGDYWASREVAFVDSARSPSETASIIRNRVVPKREGVLQIVDQLSGLQAAAHRRQQLETDVLYRGVRARLISLGTVTLVAAFVVAVLASRRVNSLQRQVEAQRVGEQEIRHELERLSARLVDAQEQERRQLSRELHDAIGQALTAIKMDIGIALRSDLNGRTRDALDEAKEITETTIQGVRDLSQLLHPSTLDDFGLPATLSTYLHRFSERTGIRAQLAATLEDRLPSEIEACIYRIVQEAMNNIAQHSAATACAVVLEAERDRVRLEIEDNGHGLPSAIDAPLKNRGLGLIAMRERAQALGGSFAIASVPGGGARVVVTLPRESSDRTREHPHEG